MKVNNLRPRIFVLFIALAMLFSGLPTFMSGDSLFTKKVFAAITDTDLPDSATGINLTSSATINITVDDATGSENVEHWHFIGFNTRFEIDEANPGDYLIIEFTDPAPTNPSFTDFDDVIDLPDPDNPSNVYAQAHITEKGVVIVFTEAVEGKHTIKGLADIRGRIIKGNTTSDETEIFEISVDGKAVLIFNVYPAESIFENTHDIDKWGQHIENSDYITWSVNINEDAESKYVGDTVIEDKFGQGFEIADDGQIKLFVFTKNSDGSWMTVEDYKKTLEGAEQTTFVSNLDSYYVSEGGYNGIKHYIMSLMYYGDDYKNPESYGYINETQGYLNYSWKEGDNFLRVSDYLGDGNMIADVTSITTTIPQDKLNNHYLVLEYVTRVTDNGEQGIYNNTARMKYSTSDSTTHSIPDGYNVEYGGSHGHATGLPYDEIKITKTLKSTGEKLEGIYFEIRKETGGDSEYQVTGDDGIASFTKLKPGTYIVRELTEDEAKNASGNPDYSYPKNLIVDPTEYTVIIGEDDYESIGNDLQVTNTLHETTQISVTKNWVDGHKFHTEKDITLTLKRISSKEGSAEETIENPSVTWDADEKTYTFNNLDKYDSDGNEYTYYVTENKVKGYADPEYSNTGDKSSEKDKAYDGCTITNRITGIVEISGTKTWDDGGIVHDNEAEVKLTLKRKSAKPDAVEETVTDVQAVWDGDTYYFHEVPKYDDEGYEYTYTVTEAQVEGYEAPEYSGDGNFDITNKKIEEEEKKPLLSVKKTSKVNAVAPGDVIPYVITVTNKGNGDAHEVVVVDIMGDNLSYVSDDNDGEVDGSRVSWYVDLPAGATKTINIKCKVDDNAQGRIINNVELSGVEDEYIEPDEGEDSEVLGVYEEEEEGAEKDEEKKEDKDKVEKVKSAKTGDEENILIWLALILVCLVSTSLMAYFRKE